MAVDPVVLSWHLNRKDSISVSGLSLTAFDDPQPLAFMNLYKVLFLSTQWP